MHLADFSSDEDLAREAEKMDREIVECRRCPRLVPYIRKIAEIKRRAYLGWEYWGRPVPSFGPANARLLILGLAPGAHGANRTGRVFTGDSSGDLLYRVLHQTGFATKAESTSRDDGLRLNDVRISCSIHCAPPDNKPLSEEIANCRYWLDRELALMPRIEVVVALGGVAFSTYVKYATGKLRGFIVRPAFGHGKLYQMQSPRGWLIGSYHPSQQNTSTGKLNEGMLLEVFLLARDILGRAKEGIED